MHDQRDLEPRSACTTILPFAARLPAHAWPILCVAALAWLVQSVARPLVVPPGAGAPWLLVADRDRSRVYELDEDLLLAGRREAGWPLQIAARSDGASWIARSGNATPDFGARLDLVARDGTLRGQLWLESHVDLAVAPDDTALCIEQADPATRRLLRVDHDVVPRMLLSDPQLRRVRAGRDALWCGTDDARVLRLSPADGAILGTLSVHGGVHDLQPDGNGGCYVLAGAAERRLLRLRADLTEDDSLQLAGSPSALAFEHRTHPATAGQVWVLDAQQRTVWRVASCPLLVAGSIALPIVEPRHLLALPDGGALVASPGAILRYDRHGQPRPGQGGFGWITSLALVGG